MFDHLERFDAVAADLDRAINAGVTILDAADGVATIERFERLRRKVAALGIAVQSELERTAVHREHGHTSAKVMARHVGRLSGAEAMARARGQRVAGALPLIGDALAEGRLGVAHHDLLARVHANPRVRHAMVEAQTWFLEIADELEWPDFVAAVRRWERLADVDGPEPANSRNHHNRHATLRQDPIDLGWQLHGTFGALQGADLAAVLERYAEAERLADWDEARSIHGDDACESHLPRTEAQRRADALSRIFDDAAANPASPVPAGHTHTVVWDQATYTEMLRRLDGEPARALDPRRARCHTLDGVPLEPTEAAADSLVGAFRRAVVDARGVVVDLGTARRFTGGARTAVQLSSRRCRWPGCWVPTTHCEIDHVHEHGRGGRTHPGNGVPLCGTHNRWKQKGYRTWRDPTGRWHVAARDGTEVP